MRNDERKLEKDFGLLRKDAPARRSHLINTNLIKSVHLLTKKDVFIKRTYLSNASIIASVNRILFKRLVSSIALRGAPYRRVYTYLIHPLIVNKYVPKK